LSEILKPVDAFSAGPVRRGGGRPPPPTESLLIKGRFEFVCRDFKGRERWRDFIDNVVTDLGANLILDQFFAGSGYTVVGPFMGLISSVSWSAVAAANTMSSHAGWTEAGVTNAPTYSGTRKTCVFASAASRTKALSAALAFAITGTGTVQGAFIVTGSGAVSTIDSTAGTLLSAGAFAEGPKAVANSQEIDVSWSCAI
jgi:hypothetical protein